MKLARLEVALGDALAEGARRGPPRLAEAMRHAVFPGGGRVRPRLCLAVAEACRLDVSGARSVESEPSPSELVVASAVAIELLHCASLVHDDLPCFDDADERRGRPSVHRRFGEPLAVLVGDGLITLAFETVARAGLRHPERVGPLVVLLARAAGAVEGLVAGQAWESEPSVSLERYHRAKTSALFVAATMAPALALGGDAEPWRALGESLGEAYQFADDLLDAYGSRELAGKPVGRDEELSRPSGAAQHGPDAVRAFEELTRRAVQSIPAGSAAPQLRALVQALAVRLLPTERASWRPGACASEPERPQQG
jgi:geranylgeranyl diphosphate synthase type II